MGARHKLNTAHVNGALIVAGLFGLVFGSLLVFLVVLAVLIVGSLHSGDIRPLGRRRR